MVRQWQQLLHGNRPVRIPIRRQWPDFVLHGASLMAATAFAATSRARLDDAIKEMIEIDKPVLFDCRVAALGKRSR